MKLGSHLDFSLSKQLAKSTAEKTRISFVTIGESMVVGQASDSSQSSPAYPPADRTIWVFSDSAVWAEITEPLEAPGSSVRWTAIEDGVGQYGHSHIGKFAWRLQKHLGSKYEVCIIPCGKSGTTSWDWAVDGDLYNDAVDKTIRALQRPNTVLAGVLLDQGVNDCGATSDPDAKTWDERWDEFISAFDADVRKAKVVDYYYRRRNDSKPAVYDSTKWTNLGTTQTAWADSRRIMFQGPDKGLIGDGPHYASFGNDLSARRLFEAVKSSPGTMIPLPTITSVKGYSGFDASTVLGTRSDEGLVGSATTYFGVILHVYLDAVPSTLQRMLWRLNGFTGFEIRSNSATLQMNAGNGVTSATAPTRTWVAGDVGKHHLLCLTSDGTKIYSMFDNAMIGTGTALAGYSPVSGKSMCLGSTDGGANPATSFKILGFCGRASQISLADFQAVCTATKAAGSLSLGAVSMDNHAIVHKDSSGTPDYMQDLIGGADFEFLQGDERNLVYESFSVSTMTWGY